MNALERPVRRLFEMMKPEWLYRDAHYLVADMEIDPDRARRIVPAPLRLAKPALASVFIGWFPDNTFGSKYHEAGLFLHVEHRFTRAIYSPWMIVDDDVALILGRELLGYPKKMGEIDLELEGDCVRGKATRRGADLIRMHGRLLGRVSDPPPILGRPHRNIRASLGIALPKVLAFTPREEPIEVRHAELEVEIGRSDRDPLADLGFGAVKAAYLHRVNLGGRGLRAVPVPCATVSPISFLKQWLIRTH